MSKSRAKKLRKRARQAASHDGALLSEGGEGQSAWYNSKGETCDRNFLSLKLEALGPFLFGQPTLCDKAVSLAKEKYFLPSTSATWRVFFEHDQWDLIQRIVTVICATIHLCESNTTFCGYFMSPTKASQDDNSLSKLVQLHSKQLKVYSLTDILPVFQMFRCHAMEFTSRANVSDPGSTFFANLADKDKLIAPVKDRGNVSYKQQRFRAAIADYTTALRLCPYSAILYCNRALCYLKNDDYWSGCLDSYRSLVLKPTWEKAYYRCAESLSKLNDLEAAFSINKIGRDMCEQKADLERQYMELLQLRKSPSSTAQTTSAAKERELARKPTSNSSAASDEIDTVVGSTSAEVRTNAKPAKTASKTEVKEKNKDEKKSSLSKSTSQKVTSKPAQSGKEVTSSTTSDTTTPPNQKKEESLTRFELLHYPVLDEKISCHQLRHLSNVVKLRNCSPASYLGHSSAWEQLEPPYSEPPKPRTDLDSNAHKPIPAVFDEIWCPVIADVEDSDTIIAPIVTYLDSGTEKQPLPALVKGPMKKMLFCTTSINNQ